MLIQLMIVYEYFAPHYDLQEETPWVLRRFRLYVLNAVKNTRITGTHPPALRIRTLFQTVRPIWSFTVKVRTYAIYFPVLIDKKRFFKYLITLLCI